MKSRTFLLTALLCLMAVLPTYAQYRPGRGYTPPAPRRSTYQGNYRRPQSHSSYAPNYYFGFRFGLSASHVNSDAPDLNGSTSKTGLNAGVVVGVQLAPQAPLFFETGLLYSEKGGKGKLNGDKFSIGLNYLEVPLVLKYSAQVAPATAVEPFVGGYVGCGIGGKVKEYGQRAAYSSFDSGYGANFKRFDGGLRVGCGLAYEMLYAEVGYDFGLTNIGDNAFDDTHNGALFVNLGLNF